MLYADRDDVLMAYEGDALPASDQRVDYLLRIASARLTALKPALPQWIADDKVDPDLACDMVVRAVLDQLRNPEGAATVSQAAGPFNVNTSYGSPSNGPAGLFRTADLALLNPGGLPVSRPGSIRMHSPWLPRHHGPLR